MCSIILLPYTSDRGPIMSGPNAVANGSTLGTIVDSVVDMIRSFAMVLIVDAIISTSRLTWPH